MTATIRRARITPIATPAFAPVLIPDLVVVCSAGEGVKLGSEEKVGDAVVCPAGEGVELRSEEKVGDAVEGSNVEDVLVLGVVEVDGSGGGLEDSGELSPEMVRVCRSSRKCGSRRISWW
jgi:hypothetical protein